MSRAMACSVEPKTDVQREAFARVHQRRRNEWKRFWKAGMKAFEAGDYEKAQLLFSDAVREARRFGETDPRFAACLNNLAMTFDMLGETAQAEAVYRRAIEADAKGLEIQYGGFVTSLTNLAQMLADEDRIAEAVQLYDRAIAFLEALHGHDTLHIAPLLSEMARMCDQDGDYAQAEAALRRALAIREHAHGPDDLSVAVTLNNLAVSCDLRGKYDEAQALLERALDIFERRLGENHPKVAETLKNLGVLHDRQGRRLQAEACFARARSILERDSQS
jgi:tetratricopeptide (TPR) repeat protein|uniref:TPR repeat protein n=1 Tax=Chloracidobacterium thermophilum TaxID=458033 RepID=A8DJS2_9BACT|nr:TPR repeat protein [Chloracidobacterium thermophilum]